MYIHMHMHMHMHMHIYIYIYTYTHIKTKKPEESKEGPQDALPASDDATRPGDSGEQTKRSSME